MRAFYIESDLLGITNFRRKSLSYHYIFYREALSKGASFSSRATPFLKKEDSTIDASANIHKSAIISSRAVILKNAFIGEHSFIGSGTVIGENVYIGKEANIGHNVVLVNCIIGNQVTIKNGTVIGQDGFGWNLGDHTTGGHSKKPQLFNVVIEDDVEIGSNCCIDRGSWRNTLIGKGSKLDNLIQIAHNVQLGQGCVIASQCGIAGSCTLGNWVFIGGQTGIIQHVTIGDNVRIAAKSGVTGALATGQTYGGCPAIPIREFHRQTLILRRWTKRKPSSPKT